MKTTIKRNYSKQWVAKTEGETKDGQLFSINTSKNYQGILLSSFHYEDERKVENGVRISKYCPLDEKNRQAWQRINHGKMRVTEKAIAIAHKEAVEQFLLEANK